MTVETRKLNQELFIKQIFLLFTLIPEQKNHYWPNSPKNIVM